MQDLAIKQAALEMGINEPFWKVLRAELLLERDAALLSLTTIPPTPDNLGMIAAAQERIRVLGAVARKPYDLLGILEPR